MSKDLVSEISTFISNVGVPGPEDFDYLEVFIQALPEEQFRQTKAFAIQPQGAGSTEHFRRLAARFAAEAKLPSLSPEYAAKLSTQAPQALLPSFTLEAADKDRVLKLCTDMRKIIYGTEEFDEPHRRRLLNRIAAIEYQIHQPRGLLDVILGGVSDIGEALGKAGKDIKPLTDRMGEVMKITRNNSDEYRQLPEPEAPEALPSPDEDSA